MYNIKTVNPKEAFMHRRLGISDERAMKIENEIRTFVIASNIDLRGAGGTSTLLEYCGKIAADDTEFGFLCFAMGATAVKLTDISPVSVEEYMQREKKIKEELETQLNKNE